MFETERLFLRRLKDYDVDEIFKMRSDEEIMRYIREPQTKRKESQHWIEMISEKWNREKIGFCGVIEKSSKTFIGWCGLWRLTETDEIEVGYAIHKDFWGKGYATEAARRCLQYGFEELNLEKIVAVAYPENEASQNVMKRLGMNRIGIGKFYGNDLVQYSISKDEFLAQNSA
ncbi:MAG: GNAT family N-acetyltransferase [Aridibacter sp.]